MRIRIAVSAVLATAFLASMGCIADAAEATPTIHHTRATAISQPDTADNPIWDDGGPRL